MKESWLDKLPWENHKEIIGDVAIIFGVGFILVLSLLVFEYGIEGFLQKFFEML